MIRHVWAKIELDGKPLWVSLDAYMANGIRRRFTAREAKAMAASLGGRLPTPRELDARWAAAALHNLPHVGNPVTRTDAQHSGDIDRDLAEYEQRYGEAYRWIVGATGKHWVHYRKDEPRRTPFVQMRAGRCAEYGWHCDTHTRRLMPAPVHPSETLADAWVIQRPWDSSHSDRYSDYAMTGVFARDTPPDSWVEIGEDGCVRTVNGPEPIVTTEPPSPAQSLGGRVAAWMLSHEGHAESPPGSNTSPLIDKWAEYTERNGRSMGGLWTNPLSNPFVKFTRMGADWCAVTWSAAVIESSEGEPPITGRVSMSELMADAKARGDFVPLADVLGGKVEPQPGWAVLWPRFDPGTTRITWRGHVDCWLGWVSKATRTADVIGGNVGNAVTRRERPLVNGKLSAHGFVRLPDETAPLRNEPDAHKPRPSTPNRRSKGIDISHHQPPASLDWLRIAQDYDWVIARASYGVSPDRYFVEHVRQARTHGLLVGAYTYVRQTQSSADQLAALVAQMERTGMGDGDIAPVIDIEDNRANGDGPADARLAGVAWQMADALHERFGDVIVYTERDVWKVLGSPAWMLEHPVWTSWPSYLSDDPWPHDAWTIWQHHHGKGTRYPERLDQNVALRLPLITEDEE